MSPLPSSSAQQKDIESLVLWKRPIKTAYHASLQLLDLGVQCTKW